MAKNNGENENNEKKWRRGVWRVAWRVTASRIRPANVTSRLALSSGQAAPSKYGRAGEHEGRLGTGRFAGELPDAARKYGEARWRINIGTEIIHR
jgi:hypothetical protein